MFAIITERYFRFAISLAFVIQYFPQILRIKKYGKPQKPFGPLVFICEIFTFIVYVECFKNFAYFVRPYMFQVIKGW